MRRHLFRSAALALTALSIVLSMLVIAPAMAQDGGTATPTAVQNLQGLQRVDQAMANLSSYLELETPISVALISADDENIPFTSYTFDPVVYTTASLGCPAAGQTYADRRVNAYRILITVRGYGTFDYRATNDGSVLIFCRGGRPHSSSVGLGLTTAGTVGVDNSQAPVAAAGLTGGPARVDQAMRHLSAYLGLRQTVTLAGVTSNDPFIVRTDYLFKPVWLFINPNACPVIAAAYAPGSVFGYEITLTVNGRNYLYYANQDGTVLVLCISGSPQRSSIGIFN